MTAAPRSRILISPVSILGAAIVAGALLCGIAVRAEAACASIPAPRTLELRKVYSDAKFSIEDKANEAYNAKLQEPIHNFFRTMERALDAPDAHPGNPEADCAFALFGRWASDGALTFEPAVYEGQGKVARALLNPSFQMIGIKFRSAGYSLNSTMLSWLRKMDEVIVNFYVKGGFYAKDGSGNNQRVWAGAGAALNSVLQPDPVALRFQNKAWRDAMAAIREDGYIDAELARGQQALVYHIYSFAATVVLERARLALGYTTSADDKRRLKNLAVRIGRTLCDPKDMERLAGTKIRVPDGPWAYVVTNGFAGDLLDANWSRCGLPQTDSNARDMGGDSRKSAAILSQTANARH